MIGIDKCLNYSLILITNYNAHAMNNLLDEISFIRLCYDSELKK